LTSIFTHKLVSNHAACQSPGCPCCIVLPSPICCELCNPSAFADFALVDIAKSSNKPARSRLPKKSALMSHDHDLRKALHEFRKRRTISKFGTPCLINTGPGIIMPNDILQRIVDCAHHHKIKTTGDLAKETRWSRVEEFGAEVLEIITSHSPTPPSSVLWPIHTPNQLPSSSNTTKLAKRTCSRCNSSDHIGKFALLLSLFPCTLTDTIF
jgi:hypothetical protein